MLLKLLKHELKNNRSTFFLLYGGLFGLSILIRLSMGSMDDANPLFGMMFLLYIVVVYSILIFTVIAIVQSYNRSMFKKEGYLTMTLPVNTSVLLFSKVLTSIIWVILSMLFLFISAFIMIPDSTSFFGDIQMLLSFFHFDKTLWMTMLLSVFSLFEGILLIYLCVTFVNTSMVKKHRTAIGVLLFFLLNYTISFLQSLFVPTLQSNSIFMDISNIEEIRIGVNTLNAYIQTTMLPSILFSILISLLCYLGIRYLLNKKIELD